MVWIFFSWLKSWVQILKLFEKASFLHFSDEVGCDLYTQILGKHTPGKHFVWYVIQSFGCFHSWIAHKCYETPANTFSHFMVMPDRLLMPILHFVLVHGLLLILVQGITIDKKLKKKRDLLFLMITQQRLLICLFLHFSIMVQVALMVS